MSILRSLYDYQVWLDSQSDAAKPGCAMIDLAFAVHLDDKGNFRGLTDLRNETKKRGTPYLTTALVPRSGKYAWQTVNVGWEYREYILGVSKDGPDEKSAQKLGSFKASLEELCDKLTGEAARQAAAIRAFYADENNLERVKADPLYPDCRAFTKCCMTFQVGDSETLFACLPGILDYVGSSHSEDSGADGPKARCLLTGEFAPFAMLHPYTPIQGSQAIAKIASWQKDSGYDSYGHKQGENAPVSVKAAEMYGRAFDKLRKSPDHAVYLGNETCLFWTQPQDEQFENAVHMFIYSITKDRDDLKSQLSAFKSAVCGGHYSNASGDLKLYILTPNRARIAVRVEAEMSIAEAAERLAQHFIDSSVADSTDTAILWPLNHLFLQLTLDGKVSSLPRAWYGSYIDSIFSGNQYPMSMYYAILRKIRQTCKISDAMAGALKGYLTRDPNSSKGDYTLALNESNTAPSYLCGRVTALIEKSVNDIAPNLGTLFGQKHFSQVTANPGLVIPQLLRVYQRQLAATPYLQRQIAEIMDNIETMPTHLTSMEQGSFVLGYYQQRQALYRKRATPEDGSVVSLSVKDAE